MAREKLKLAIIQTDGGTQVREELDKAVIAEYADAYKRGDKLPLIVVFYDGKRYWLADGFHRHYAMLFECDIKTATCDVRKGSKEDAAWYACAANQIHGLRRSNADKRRAAEMALLHANGAKLSDHQIAEHVGVANHTVAKIRKQLISVGKLSQQESHEGKDGKQYKATKPPKPKSDKPDDPPPAPPDDPAPSAVVETEEDVVFIPPAPQSEPEPEKQAEEPEPDKADTAADEWAEKWIHKYKLSTALAAAKIENLAARIRAS